MPKNTRKWLEIAEKFYQQWDFVNGTVLGSFCANLTNFV